MPKNKSSKIYIAFYKPYGVLSQFTPESKGDLTLKDYFPKIPKDVYPIGRLDKDSEGLLFLTNDNIFKNKILDPINKISKTYWAQVDGLISREALVSLAEGVPIRIKNSSYQTRPAKASIILPENIPERNPPIRYRKSIPTSWVSLTISEGKNRQVRRMGAAVGFPVLRLIRVQIANYKLSSLKPGNWEKIHPGMVY